jgi:hypothetical protein
MNRDTWENTNNAFTRNVKQEGIALWTKSKNI